MAQRITVTVSTHGDTEPIELGHQGENLATTVEFDISAWLDAFGIGTCILLNQRKNETPYPVTVRQDGNIIYWTVTDVDTGIVGTGYCELQYYVGNVLVKSGKWLTHTKESLGDAGDPPEPWDGFLDQVAELAAAAEEAASSAESSKAVAVEQADKAEESANTATDAATEAKEAAEQAKMSADNAGYFYVEGGDDGILYYVHTTDVDYLEFEDVGGVLYVNYH